MELWDSVPQDVRAALRPLDYAEVYPPCGCDPETTPLRYLDLMAEAAVAGRLCGERERALKIVKRALRLLEDEPDPLRAAWFWVQRSKLMQALARGDGWAELGTAQDLVRGLPPSEVHAEVLLTAANWSMLHEPGPEAMTAAERAVEYARMVGAPTIELNARLTLGGLRVDAGEIEAGLAEMYEVRERATELGMHTELRHRAHVNLPSVLEGVGRSEEAIGILEEGVLLTRRAGVMDSEGWVWGNLAESLHTLGRWDEAAAAAANAQRIEQSAKPLTGGSVRLAFLALDRGDMSGAARHLSAARAYFGTHDPMPQYSLPMSCIAIRVAAAEGRLPDARAELLKVLDTALPPGTQRYGWPLLLAAATAEADAFALRAAEPDRAEILEHIRKAAKTLATGVPVWRVHDQWLRAELLRAEGRCVPEEWSSLVAAMEPLERPYDLGRVRYRLAEALLASGAGDDERARATELLRLAHAVADHLGARPLADAVTLLAQRARLTLSHAPERAVAAADPAEALGLTNRERDVLRLVAAGRTNRQIAEELFISPKTASVHVSNILAKLGVSGRGEAAAVAHRTGLFPAETLTSRTPG
jgi:DNA-binding CsgD family transcriptional regulator